jgi:hypothetical protein
MKSFTRVPVFSLAPSACRWLNVASAPILPMFVAPRPLTSKKPRSPPVRAMRPVVA